MSRCRKSPFLQIFLMLAMYFSMVWFLIKLIFVAETYSKSPEQPVSAGKTAFLESPELLFRSFDEIFHTVSKWKFLKVMEPDFRRSCFTGSKFRKNIGKAVFHFLRISSILFSDFCTKMYDVDNIQNVTRPKFGEKIFSSRNLFLLFFFIFYLNH